MSTPDSISFATPSDLPRLFEVWLTSVRATHAFLGESDIQALIPLVKKELAVLTPIHVLRDAQGQVIAMLAVEGGALEMLFVHGDHRGQGAGRRLTEFAIRELGATRVEVNEQNPQAVGFYERMGFRTCERSPCDSQGRPFPLLRMKLAIEAVR